MDAVNSTSNFTTGFIKDFVDVVAPEIVAPVEVVVPVIPEVASGPTTYVIPAWSYHNT